MGNSTPTPGTDNPAPRALSSSSTETNNTTNTTTTPSVAAAFNNWLADVPSSGQQRRNAIVPNGYGWIEGGTLAGEVGRGAKPQDMPAGEAAREEQPQGMLVSVLRALGLN